VQASFVVMLQDMHNLGVCINICNMTLGARRAQQWGNCPVDSIKMKPKLCSVSDNV